MTTALHSTPRILRTEGIDYLGLTLNIGPFDKIDTVRDGFKDLVYCFPDRFGFAGKIDYQGFSSGSRQLPTEDGSRNILK